MIGILLALAMPDMKPITITSFNVRYGTANDGENRWEIRRPRALGIIRQNRPDILCLQEALDFQVDEFAAATRFHAVGVGRDDGRRKGEYSAILFNPFRFNLVDSGTFWLSDTPEKIASKNWGNNVVRICTWAVLEDSASRQKFRVYNTHLDHESQPSREKGVALILRRIGVAGPTIVTGDFNAGETNPVNRIMREGGFRDTWRVINPSLPEPGTFSGFKELGKDKIDYVWVDKNWKVRSTSIETAKLYGGWPSDHVPVSASVHLEN